VLKQIFSLVSQHYGLAFHLVEKPEQVFRNKREMDEI
jgi:hypothetical protein